MDPFTDSVMAAASGSSMPTMLLNQHLRVLRDVVPSTAEAVLVLSCLRTDHHPKGERLFIATVDQLLLTRPRMLRGIQLDLAADRAEVHELTWQPHKRIPAIELSFLYSDNPYKLLFKTFQPEDVVRVNTVLTRALAA
jgi:hypothetical protein